MPGAYVTQLSDGQVQVRVPRTSSTGTTATSFGSPVQTDSGASGPESTTAQTTSSLLGLLPLTVPGEKPTLEGIPSGARSATIGTTRPSAGAPVQTNSGASNSEAVTVQTTTSLPGILPLTVLSGKSTFRGIAPESQPTSLAPSSSSTTDSIARSANNDIPPIKDSSTAMGGSTFNTASRVPPSSSSTIADTSGSSTQFDFEPLPETEAPSLVLTGTATTTSSIGLSEFSDLGNESEAQGDELSSGMNESPGLAPSTEAGDLSAAAEQSGSDIPPRLTSSVSAIQSSSAGGSSPSGTQSQISTFVTKAASIGANPIGAEPSLNGPIRTTPTLMTSGSITGEPVALDGPLPPLGNPGNQGTETTPEDVPELVGDFPNVPTATQTTAPPKVKLEVVTNPAWTKDTLITTTIPGSTEPTMVPVFANCDGCGLGGSLVVLGSFIPGISYNMPKLPGGPQIPRFHLTCIAFCPSPGGPPPGTGPPPKPGPPQREDKNGNDIDDGGDDDTEDDGEEDDDEEDEDEEEEDEDDEEQTTSSQAADATSQVSTETGISSSHPSSTGSSTSSGTGVAAITDTAYIDVRPTDIQARDPTMDQYLLAAYSSLGIADDQSDPGSLPTSTGMPTSTSGSVSRTPSAMSSSSSVASLSPVPSTSSSSSSAPAPSPTEEAPEAEEEPAEEDPPTVEPK
ncbi:MAG: hypothetical protein Q9169_007813, partial [Polycauliona sp. 2 TL-2023]